MLTSRSAGNTDENKQYYAEIRSRIAKKTVPYLYVIDDLLADNVLSEKADLSLSYKVDLSNYS